MSHARRVIRPLLPFLLIPLLATGCDLFDSEGFGNNRNIRIEQGIQTGFAIDISGGRGTVGTGGTGNGETGIWFENYGPLGVKVYRTGTADASFTLEIPAATPGFGAEPLMVDADMTIPVYDVDPADNDVYYFRSNDPNLYHKIDDSTINAVTGIRVGPGVTLTLGINSDFNGFGGYETAALALENDIEVQGTLRSAAFENAAIQESGEAIDRGGLALSPSGGVFIRSTGVVSTAGDSASTGRGGHGGAIQISLSAGGATNGGILVNEGRIDASGGSTTDPAGEGGSSANYGGYGDRLNLYAELGFVSTGTIRADGGSGGSGGYAGGSLGNSFSIRSSGTVQNAGVVSLSGGVGTNGDGRDGGLLNMAAGGVFLHNSGAITTRGGNGSVYGGNGGTVSLYLESVGDLLNSGPIDASGGDSTGTDESVATGGGQGASIYLYAYGGKLITSGSLEAGGGDVANMNPGSYGGSGGYVDIESYPDYWGGGALSGPLEISGNIFARGGTGPGGGNGGAVYAYYEDAGGTGGIVLRGYTSLIDNGGSGVTTGGDGGGVYLYDYSSGGESAGLLAEADISANGGGATDSGGYGGYVELDSSVPPSQYRGITVDGGAGAAPGSAGTINIDGGGGPT